MEKKEINKAVSRYLATDKVGLFELFTPGEVLNDLNSVNTEMKILKGDIDNMDDDTMQDAFELFFNEWIEFYNTNSKGIFGYVGRALNSTYDATWEFKRRLKEWQDRLKTRGIETSSTNLYTAKKERPESTTSSFGFTKITSTVAIAGVLFFAYLFWPSKGR